MSALEKPEKFSYEEATEGAIFLSHDLEFIDSRPTLPQDYQTAVGTLALLNQLGKKYSQSEIIQKVNLADQTLSIYLKDKRTL